MSWKRTCEPGCTSWRCPAALERIAAGWRNGRDPVAGMPCRDYFNCRWPECDCTHAVPVLQKGTSDG